MALIKCAECGKEISSKASSCPNCGCPIEKETKKVIITRATGFPLIKGHISIDNQVVGNLKSGETIELDLSIGTHYVSVSTNVNNTGNIFNPGTNSVNVEGEQFTIEEKHEKVYILVVGKGSFTGSTGTLVIKSINYE